MVKVLPFLQKLVSADKTPIAGALVGLLTVLAAKFGFKMNGSDVAYLSAGVMAGLGLFVHAHFAAQPPQVHLAVVKDVPGASVSEPPVLPAEPLSP